jgi:hypothetical protein
VKNWQIWLRFGRAVIVAGKQFSIGFQPVSELDTTTLVEPWTGLSWEIPRPKPQAMLSGRFGRQIGNRFTADQLMNKMPEETTFLLSRFLERKECWQLFSLTCRAGERATPTT